MSQPTTIPLCDPHHHLWDLLSHPNPNLGKGALPSYLPADYAADMAQLPAPLDLVSSVHVETVVGQTPGEAVVDTVDETRWVCSQLSPDPTRPFGIVAYVHLAQPLSTVEAVLDQHAEAAQGRLCGVRQILNHDPDDPSLTWPQVEGDLLNRPAFSQGLALLEKRGLSFDLSCHPRQVAKAATVLQKHPDLRVVINHLSFLRQGHEEEWRRAIAVLAALPNAYMKLSMLPYGHPGYHQSPASQKHMGDYVRETIEAFGPDRCMFASNYPVDKVMGIGIADLYGGFLEWSADLSDPERRALFHDTAVRAYGGFSS
jgi:predicted TIM-barrel fold metal-dependent hydrolase